MADLTLAECQALITESGLEFYVYVLVKPSGQPFYAGKGRAQRLSKHEREAKSGVRSHRHSIIRNIWDGGGVVLYRLEGHFSDEVAAFAAEKRVIAAIGRRAHGGPLVNLTDGGEGPAGFSQIITLEMREKISAALKGRKKDPEHVAKVAAKRRGCRHSAEVRAKIAEAVGRPEAVARIAAARADFRHSEASIEKNRAAHLGRKASEETRAKMSASRRGAVASQEARAKMSAVALARPPMSDATKQKIRAARAKQAPMSEDARAKCAEAARQMQARKRTGLLDNPSLR
jgi:hypothetical protein